MPLCKKEMIWSKYGIRKQVLSPKAKENLQRNAELRQKDNKFIKLQPSEKKVY
jgi:hypothetical protein